MPSPCLSCSRGVPLFNLVTPLYTRTPFSPHTGDRVEMARAFEELLELDGTLHSMDNVSAFASACSSVCVLVPVASVSYAVVVPVRAWLFSHRSLLVVLSPRRLPTTRPLLYAPLFPGSVFPSPFPFSAFLVFPPFLCRRTPLRLPLRSPLS